jgi:hypothetical protein
VYLGHHTGSSEPLSDNIWIGSNIVGNESASLKIGNLLSGNMDSHELRVHGALYSDKFTDGVLEIQHGNIDANRFTDGVLEIQHGEIHHARHLRADRGNIDQLHANVGNIHFANIDQLHANVGNIHFANIDQLHANVGNIHFANIDQLHANVGNIHFASVGHLHVTQRVVAPEFTDGHLSVTNGNITGISALEINDCTVFFENGKLKFRWEGKTYVVQSELE